MSRSTILIPLMLSVMIAGIPARCPATAAEKPAAEKAQPTPADEMAIRQETLSDKFARMEQLMLKMAELDAATNPRRAALLKRGVAQAKNRHIRLQLDTIVGLLQDQQFGRSSDLQQDVNGDLRALLNLLLSENRPERLQDEQARIRNYIKEIERILRQQRHIQAGTEANEGMKGLAEQQADVAERTGELGRQMKQNEESGARQGSDSQPDAEGQSEDKTARPQEDTEKDNLDAKDASNKPEKKGGSPSEQPDSDDSQNKDTQGQDVENQNRDSQDKQDKNSAPDDSQNNSKPSDGSGKPSDQSQPAEGQPAESSDAPSQPQDQPEQGGPGQPSERQPQNNAPQQNEFSPRKRVQTAEQRMREAQRKLEEAKQDGAIDQQEKARTELEQALAELEEILRQLREEEIERMLAMLEGRFRKMLEMQLKVYESTKKLDEIPLDDRSRAEDIESSKLSLDERKIVLEASKALVLLREESSSIAFPEVVEQIRNDMQQVVDRLAQTKVGRITQGIEQDIIASLEEMIEALQLEQKEREENRPPPPGRPGPSPDLKLVDMLAELKMIRAMEQRVYKRTQRYANLLDDPEDIAGQAQRSELRSALRRLGERQRSISRITRDIVLGKNK